MAHHPPTQHSHKHHREMHVAHRRVKHVLKSGGHAGPEHGEHLVSRAEKLTKAMREHEESERHEGYLRGGRLDKKARGGKVNAYQFGGAAIKPPHKFTPSKHKPHTTVNIVNMHRPGGGGGIGGGLGLRPRLPIAPPTMAGGPTMGPPMKRGGKIQKRQLGGPLGAAPAVAPPIGGAGINPVAAALARRRMAAAAMGAGAPAVAPRAFAKGGKAQMRKGKKYGEGSGEGRLEEFEHMKGK